MPEALGDIAPGGWPVLPVEPLALFLAGLLGMAQRLVPGEAGVVVNRNFGETFPVFVALIGVLWLLDGFGEYSASGAVLYVSGRALYLALTPKPVSAVRRFAWALSIAGILGLALQAVSGAI